MKGPVRAVFGPWRQLLSGTIVFLLGAGVAVFAGDADDGGGRQLRTLGPAPGQQIDDYLAQAREALAGAGRIEFAAVVFTEYVDEPEARERVSLPAEGSWVAVPGGVAQVTDDVDAWRRAEAESSRAEAAEFESIIPTAEDPDFVRQYEQDRDRALRRAAAAEGGEPVVFGVVVRARGGALRAIARRPGVRYVQIIEPERMTATHVLRPEETRVVDQPPERP